VPASEQSVKKLHNLLLAVASNSLTSALLGPQNVRALGLIPSLL
jgi:hypothetical protein